MPPRITIAVSTVITAPVIHGETPKVSLQPAEIELACTMQPMPKAATAVSAANSMPSRLLPRPRSSAYIGPPAIMPLGVLDPVLHREHRLGVLGGDRRTRR